MAGLLRRGRTGRGGVTDLPMLDTMAYFNFPDMMVERTCVGDDGPSLNGHLAANRPVATADGWILVNPVAGRHIKAALVALGLEAHKSELLAITDATEMSSTFCALTESVTRTKPSAHWITVLSDSGVPVSPVLDFDGHLANEQVLHNRIYHVVEHPVLGTIRAPHHPSVPDGEIEPAPSLADRAARR